MRGALHLGLMLLPTETSHSESKAVQKVGQESARGLTWPPMTCGKTEAWGTEGLSQGGTSQS